MRISRLPMLCLLLPLTAGCGKSLDPPVDPVQATEVLSAALDAWKDGESFGALELRRPPIHFNEREWESGKKLMKYEVGEVTLSGRQGRCSVKLILQDNTGKVKERVIGYQIDTTPNIVIARETLGP